METGNNENHFFIFTQILRDRLSRRPINDKWWVNNEGIFFHLVICVIYSY